MRSFVSEMIPAKVKVNKTDVRGYSTRNKISVSAVAILTLNVRVHTQFIYLPYYLLNFCYRAKWVYSKVVQPF